MRWIDKKKFCFEHLDLFAWRDEDLETYGARSELVDVLISAAEKGECWTGIYDGRIVVIGGVLPYTEKTGYCFTIFSEHADRHRTATARATRRMFESMVDTMGLHRIVTYNRIGAHEHNKWCEWLGFKREGVVEKFDDAGNDYVQYALVR